MTVTYRQLVARISGTPLLLDEPALRRLEALLGTVSADEEVDVDRLAEITGAVRANPRAAGAVAVVQLHGFIQKREDIWTRLGIAVSTDAFVERMRQAMGDPTVKAVVMDIDSPGGYHSGTPEAADAIYALRGSKPMVAVSNTLNASAAYFLGSQADEVVGSPSSDTGSIGVWLMHMDQSGWLEQLGLRVTYISAGKYKVEANAAEPLKDEARDYLQSVVDDAYDQFTKAVARGRGVTVAAVRGGYGEGRVLTAARAKEAGLIDRIATLEQTVARFGGSLSGSVARSEASPELSDADQQQMERERHELDLARWRSA